MIKVENKEQWDILKRCMKDKNTKIEFIPGTIDIEYISDKWICLRELDNFIHLFPVGFSKEHWKLDNHKRDYSITHVLKIPFDFSTSGSMSRLKYLGKTISYGLLVKDVNIKCNKDVKDIIAKELI